MFKTAGCCELKIYLTTIIRFRLQGIWIWLVELCCCKRSFTFYSLGLLRYILHASNGMLCMGDGFKLAVVMFMPTSSTAAMPPYISPLVMLAGLLAVIILYVSIHGYHSTSTCMPHLLLLPLALYLSSVERRRSHYRVRVRVGVRVGLSLSLTCVTIDHNNTINVAPACARAGY
jgi:hypothetical protein